VVICGCGEESPKALYEIVEELSSDAAFTALAAGEHAGHENPVLRRHVCGEGEQGGKQLPHVPADIPVVIKGLSEMPGHGIKSPLEHRQEQGVLAGKIIIEAGLGYPAGPADLADAHRFKALEGEQPGGLDQDVFPGIPGVAGLAHARSWPFLNLLLKMAEFHGEGAPALGGAAKGRGVAEHPFQRCLGVDVFHRRPRFDFLDDAAPHGHARHHLADEVLWRHDIDAHHRLQHHRSGIGTGLVEGHAGRGFIGELAGGIRVEFDRGQFHADVDAGIAVLDAAAQGRFKSPAGPPRAWPRAGDRCRRGWLPNCRCRALRGLPRWSRWRSAPCRRSVWKSARYG
jgi:hypothetical protein